MQVASDATLKRASRLRDSNRDKSWLELTRATNARSSGLEFFRGSRAPDKDGADKK